MNYYNQPYYNNAQFGFSYVNGVDEAKAFLVPINCTYFLRDMNSTMCFEKHTNSTGKWTLKVYNLVEVQPDEPVKKSEITALEQKINELTLLIKGGQEHD
jgi:hypothetical protein